MKAFTSRSLAPLFFIVRAWATIGSIDCTIMSCCWLARLSCSICAETLPLWYFWASPRNFMAAPGLTRLIFAAVSSASWGVEYLELFRIA